MGNSSRSSIMRNMVKLLALTLIMSVILRDTEGAKLNAVKGIAVEGPYDDVTPPVSGGNNVTHTSGSTGTHTGTVGVGLGGPKSCAQIYLWYTCLSDDGEQCCYRHP